MMYSPTHSSPPSPFLPPSVSLAAWVSILGWSCLLILFFIFYPGREAGVTGNQFMHRMQLLAGDGAVDCGNTYVVRYDFGDPLPRSSCVSKALAAGKPFSVTYQNLWDEDYWFWTGIARSKDGEFWLGYLAPEGGVARLQSPDLPGTMETQRCPSVDFTGPNGELECGFEDQRTQITANIAAFFNSHRVPCCADK